MDGRGIDDGDTSSIAFVCTQTDSLNRWEMVQNLRLAEDATALECALARNRFAAKRIKSDFREGLRDIAMAAGGDEGEADLDREVDPTLARRLQACKIPVFTVSSRDYQSLSGLIDEPPVVFSDLYDTGIPALQSFLYLRSLEGEEALLRRLAARITVLLNSIAALVSGDHADGGADGGAQLRQYFEERVYPQLRQSLDGAAANQAIASIRANFASRQPAAKVAGLNAGKQVVRQYSLVRIDGVCAQANVHSHDSLSHSRGSVVGGPLVLRRPCAPADCTGVLSKRFVDARGSTRAPRAVHWTSTRSCRVATSDASLSRGTRSSRSTCGSCSTNRGRTSPAWWQPR